ncbi:YedE family putative selenium metabolism protein [Desulfomicrobium macestii]|uniref:YedE family putative selenium metabolism protein n=1 Tax=Desulfomicrobium macestii TaxID=90731 RepID=A0ABR9H031_9BACT|nr:YedE family putative selenium transporter [Desulfomicrobium macestii]MBE1424065.1 YedE family putative selenium metabolism protein [Desulfomicrobium macestii]
MAREVKNVFATSLGILAVGAIIGVVAGFLQKFGNPANMGICVACFGRDIAGALGLHRAAVVQYMRPEIIGFVLGSFAAALAFKEFKPSGGSAPITRFVLGMIAMIGALVFLGCPWRVILRLAGGDGNALFGLLGLVTGVWIGTLFFKSGFNLGRTQVQSMSTGLLLPLMMLGLLALRLIFPPVAGEAQSGVLWYSLKGPGAAYAPLFLSLGAGLGIGFLAQRSRFCTMGAIRDVLLFNQWYLMTGFLALLVAALVTNVLLGQFNPGFEGQPVAHTMWFWNFAGMLMAGLAFALAGGCPGRQLFMSGEGNSDAGIFVLGSIVGAGIAHNFGLASSPSGIGPHGMAAVVIGMVVLVFIGVTNRK